MKLKVIASIQLYLGLAFLIYSIFSFLGEVVLNVGNILTLIGISGILILQGLANRTKAKKVLKE